MNQKGFINIIVIIGIVVLAGVAGYFVVSQRTFSPASTPSPTPNPTTPIQPSTTDIGQKPPAPSTAEYPYVLKPLAQTQLSSLRAEFEASGQNKNICTQINEYSFTEFQSGCFGEMLKTEITNETGIVETVKNWLIQNSKFTGVANKSDLVGENVVKIGNPLLRIDFRGQTYNSLPVEGDIKPLIVFANANGISRIDGYWFPKITVPLEPKISESSAKNKINGRTFTYGDIAGNPRDYRVEQKDLSNVAHKVVFVKKSSQGLEFRLAWKIQVGQGTSWTVYIDALTGEELKVVQMFQT